MTNSGSQARILLGCHVDHDIQLFKCLKATISPGGLEGAHEDLSSQIRGKKILVFYILQKKKTTRTPLNVMGVAFQIGGRMMNSVNCSGMTR